MHRLNPRLAAANRPGWLRELRVARASLGASAPRLSRARLRLLDGGAGCELTLRLDYAAGRDLRLQLDAVVAPALRIPLHATKLALCGDLRVTVGGLSPAFPWVSALRCAFTAPPDLDLAVSPVAGAAGVPGVSRWLRAFAAAALATHAAEPRARGFNLAARLGDATPKARLTVAVHDARALPVHAGADPFVRVALHSSAAETGVRRRGRDPRFGGQQLSFDVYSWEKARLRVDVLGWRPRGAAVHLGTALVDLRAARVCAGLRGDGAATPLTLRLSVPGPGAEGVDPDAPPGAAGELDLVLNLLDFSRPDAPAPPPPLPPFLEADGDGAGDVAAVPQLKIRAPDAADVPPRTLDGRPLRLDELAAAEAAAIVALVEGRPPPQPKPKPVSPPPPEPAAPVAPAEPAAVVEEAPPPEADAAVPPPTPATDDVATMEASAEAAADAAVPAAPADGPSASASFVSPFAAPAVAAPPSVFLLDVTVHRAEALVASVESDPYVRLALGPSLAETGVRRRMVDPDFNDQRFTLRCRGWGERAASLRVQALGWLPRGAEPVPLGAAALPLREALLDGRLVADGPAWECRLELLGVPHGALLLSLAVRDLVEPPPEHAPDEAAEEIPPPPTPPAGDADSGFHEVQLNVPGWAQALEADADALAATSDAPAVMPAAEPARAATGVTRRASAPAKHL